MKIILLSQVNQVWLVNKLHEQGHAVALSTSDFERATSAIFRTRPHAILVCGNSGESFVRRASEFISLLPDQRLVLHQPGDSTEILEQQLAKIRQQVTKTKQAPIADQRLLLFDSAYNGLLEGRKLNTAKPEHSVLLSEQDKLLTLLEQALAHQQEASFYRNEIRQWAPDETREIAYRMMHGSFKALAYAQEQVGRWLGVLAHYIPGVDLCYLPSPGDAIHGVRWVFHGSSPESRYAFESTKELGFIECLCEPIRALLSQTFAHGEDALMAHASLALMGSSALLQDVAEAHLSAIDRYLAGDMEKLLQDVQERSVRREHQIFCEFWNLPLLREYPQLLAKTIDDFHRGRRTATKVSAPSFLTILAETQQAES